MERSNLKEVGHALFSAVMILGALQLIGCGGGGDSGATGTTGPAVLQSVVVSPSTATVTVGSTQTFTATGLDQYGAVFSTTFTWTVTGEGTINASGVFTATTAGGPFMATATSTDNNTISGTADVTVVDSVPVPSGNLALGQPAVASSQQTTQYVPGNAVDGDGATRWSSLYSDPQWIYVDLGAVYPINEVLLSWEAAYGKAYQIQVSTDATTWTTVFTESNGNGGTDDITFSSVDARYVRVYGTQRGTAYGYSLWEFEVYGSLVGAQTPLFVDRFSDGNSSGWAVVDNATAKAPSHWTVINNAYVENSGASYSDGVGIFGQTTDGYEIGTYSWLTSSGAASPFGAMDLNLRLRSDGIGVIGVMFGYQDDNNYYRFSLSKREGYRKLEKKVAGVFSELATSPQSYTTGAWMTLRIVHQNGVIIVFLDGQQVAASNDKTFSGGRIGLWTGRNTAATFDDIVVFNPPTQPVIGIASPGEYAVYPGGTVDVSAVVNDMSAVGGVDFVADEGTLNETTLPGTLVTPSDPMKSPYYSATFPYSTSGNHDITAYALDGSLNRLGNVDASDVVDMVGVHGINLAGFGDSITDGVYDNLSTDDISADFRNTSGGYEPVLNDGISAAFPAKPVTVIDEGKPGDQSWQGVDKIGTVLAHNPQAEAVLVMFGTNDANTTLPTNPVDFKANLKTICDAAIAAGKKVFIAKPPPLQGSSAGNNTNLQSYNSEIDVLIADYGSSNPGKVFAGPNFYNDAVPIQIGTDGIHPTGQGYHEMGVQWSSVIIVKINGGVL